LSEEEETEEEEEKEEIGRPAVAKPS